MINLLQSHYWEVGLTLKREETWRFSIWSIQIWGSHRQNYWGNKKFFNETLNDKIWQMLMNTLMKTACLKTHWASLQVALHLACLFWSWMNQILSENLIRAQPLTTAVVRLYLFMLSPGACLPLCNNWCVGPTSGPSQLQNGFAHVWSHFTFRWVSLELPTSPLHATQVLFHSLTSFCDTWKRNWTKWCDFSFVYMQHYFLIQDFLGNPASASLSSSDQHISV